MIPQGGAGGLLTQLVLADGGDGAVQLQARQGQVVGLAAGVLAHLLDADVSPALLLLLGGVQGPRGRRADTTQEEITSVRKRLRSGRLLNWWLTTHSWVTKLFRLGRDFMATPPLHINNDIKMFCMYCAGHTVPFNNVIPLWTRCDRKWAGGSL